VHRRDLKRRFGSHGPGTGFASPEAALIRFFFSHAGFVYDQKLANISNG